VRAWWERERFPVSKMEADRLIEMLMRIDERTAFIVRWIEERADDELDEED
jgi:hypothetical protein